MEFTDKTRVLFYARIRKAAFTNFRNIEEGSIEFPNASPQDFIQGEPSVLGLYGQNGSGKTSVIMALGILKNVLSGRPLERNYMSCIRSGCDRCTLAFEFLMYGRAFGENDAPVELEDEVIFNVYYEFDITSEEEETTDTDELGEVKKRKILCVENEVIRFRYTDGEGNVVIPKQAIIDTSFATSDAKGRAFGNDTKYTMITENNPDIHQQLRDLKAVTHAKSQSFVFAPKVLRLLLDCLSNAAQSIDKLKAFSDRLGALTSADEVSDAELLRARNMFTKMLFGDILDSLARFGNAYLHVVDTVTTGLTNINQRLPLLLWGSMHGHGILTVNAALQMNGPTQVPEQIYKPVQAALCAVNDVLSKIIPGLVLSFDDLGTKMSSENKTMHCFEVMSHRGDVTIPLRYESDGIRRIISILSLLIAVYNEPSMTVAIDEIDSGIFEYLLGEVLQVLSDSAKGQIIFTSHNLRPLEVLPAKYLCFTTVNPGNRFTKLQDRGNSNLRDSYFRSIILGTTKEAVYNPTDRYEIELAFAEAGQIEVEQ